MHGRLLFSFGSEGLDTGSSKRDWSGLRGLRSRSLAGPRGPFSALLSVLRVPLVCVTGQLQVKRFGQMTGGFVRGKPVDGTPEIEDVASGCARRMETLENVLAQVNGKRAVFGTLGAVDRTGPAALLAPATQAAEVAQVAQHLFHRDLAAQMGEVDRGGRRLARNLRLDNRWLGDHDVGRG